MKATDDVPLLLQPFGERPDLEAVSTVWSFATNFAQALGLKVEEVKPVPRPPRGPGLLVGPLRAPLADALRAYTPKRDEP